MKLFVTWGRVLATSSEAIKLAVTHMTLFLTHAHIVVEAMCMVLSVINSRMAEKKHLKKVMRAQVQKNRFEEVRGLKDFAEFGGMLHLPNSPPDFPLFGNWHCNIVGIAIQIKIVELIVFKK